ncbi:MAG: sugar phosphate isomerase/epimerase family protein [Planctomycetota bacterium]
MDRGRPSLVSRRDVLKLGLAGAALGAWPRALAAEARGEPKTRAKVPIALQLYSVRHECERDLPKVIAAVAKMGYEAVEFAGYYGRNAKELRKLLDDHGLKCCGTHTGLETLLGDELAKTIEFHKTLDNKYLVVPGLPRERTASAQAWLETAKLFNEISKKLEPHDMLVGYHNHAIEFRPLDGQIPWDIFFGNTASAVIMQIDIGNAMSGGGDPLAFVKKYPGRAVTVHVKEYSKKDPKALIGEGEVDWPRMFEALETVGGTKWYIVEYESDAYPPLESVKRCLENLRKMGK